MTKDLNNSAKQIADEIINMSALLDKKMQKWSDVSRRPENLSSTECVGFINKETDENGLNFVVDAQAPNDKKEATIRIWAIESKQDPEGVERFNNIQLNFTMEHSQALALTKMDGAVTRDDIRSALHDENTWLTRLVVSNQSGLDKASQQLGERYDLTIDELNDPEISDDKIINVLTTVLGTLKQSAAIEAA